ncbi:MAG: hypothetical protein JWO11_4494 [Nocardioides sp.]|nr:hypothetical protein [Nocardioides sp.]
MDDLATWLRAQLDEDERELDEDERVARSATQAAWWHNRRKQWLGPEAFEAYDQTKGEEFVGYGESPFSGCVAATGPADHPQSVADAEHIARWHPARVLARVATERAEVDAKRRVLDLHRPVPTGPTWQPGPPQCEHCASLCHSRSGLACESPDAPYPCETVRLVALPFGERDGWREEWRPQP